MRKFLLFFIAFFLSACVSEYDKHHITLNDPNGVDTQFSPKDRSLKIDDKPFLLFFFGFDCGVCKKQIPDLNELYAQYANSINFIAILGPSKGFDKDMALLNEHNVKFKSISDKISVDYFSKAVGGVMGVPVVYIYDKNGKMRSKFIGLTPKSVLEKEIKLAL